MTKVSSVKSAYHVVEDTKERERTRQVGNSSSMLEGDFGVRWQKLWKLTCPPKVKLFLWRLGHDSLPLRMNIMRRGMEIDTKCPVCWRLDEYGGHCFLKCKVVKKFWSHMNLEDTRIQLLSLNNAEEVVDHILSMNESDKLSVIDLLWAWWNARNKCNAGEQMKTMKAISFCAHEVVSECGGARPKPIQSPVSGRKSWQPPPVDVLKLNFDGTFRATEKDMEHGVSSSEAVMDRRSWQDRVVCLQFLMLCRRKGKHVWPS